MKKSLLVILAVLFGGHLFGQAFQIGHTTVTLVDGSRGNRNITTEIYYPADLAGDNVAVAAGGGGTFPVLSFGHGFVMTWDAYRNIWEALVPEGFIIAFPKTEGSLSPSHLEFGKDLAFVISELTALGGDSSSLFYNRIGVMNCVMGHSMGGGAAFLAAEFSPGVKTLATLSAAETSPSAIAAAGSIGIPSLVFAGGNDCVTPPGTNQVPMYQALQSGCKTFISVVGGSHCQMAENNFFCSFGEGSCSPTPTISRGEQHIVVERYLLRWLKYELKGDCVAGGEFDSLILGDGDIVFEKNCLLCNVFSVDEVAGSLNASVFPNPFDDRIFIQCGKSVFGDVVVDLYLMNGRKIFSETFLNIGGNERLLLNVNGDLGAGVYLVRVVVGGEVYFRKVIRE